MKKLLIIPLLLISLISSATNYYIKNSGNNSNTGLSDTQAWATIAKLNSVSFSPGDIISFNKGDTWTESVALTPKSSGTSGHSIIFTTYGSGSAPTIKVSDGSFCAYISSLNYLKFNGLVFDGSLQTRSLQVIKVDGTSGYIEFTNCTLQNGGADGLYAGYYTQHINMSHCTISGNGRYPDGPPHGMYIVGHDNIFEYLNVYNNSHYGIQLFSGTSLITNNNIIRYCFIHENGASGIIVSSGTGNQVYYNIFSNNGKVYISDGFGIRLQYSGINTIVYNNTVYGNPTYGIYVATDATGCIIKNNIVYGNVGTIQNLGGAILSNNLYSNPSFVNGGGSYQLDTDFKISSTSAAKDVGTNVGLTVDYFGTIVPFNRIQDIGVHEFGSALTALAVPVYQNSVLEDASPAILVMNYDLSLVNIAPPTSAFTVLVNSVVRDINAVAVLGTKVQLTLASKVFKGDVVKITYTIPLSNQLEIASGGMAASLTSQTAINNITIVAPFKTESQVVMTVKTNPVHRILNVLLSYTTPLTGDQANVLEDFRILDIYGNILIEKLLDNTILNVKIPINLSSGIYIVQLVIGGLEMASQKFIVY